MKITYPSSPKDEDVTSTLLDSLFKIYDLEDYRKKAYSALRTNDYTLAKVYTIKLEGTLATGGKAKFDQSF